MGSDGTMQKNLGNLDVSIHAPTWGATLGSLVGREAVGFQSTLPHGERHSSESISLTIGEFQSTLPHGERHAAAIDWYSEDSFNPRSHMGSD